MSKNPYTFSLYNRDGKLLVNCYGDYSDAPRGGEVLNGCAPTRAEADRRIAELRARITVAVSAMLWRHDKAIKVAA